jgi:hypothetical protein
VEFLGFGGGDGDNQQQDQQWPRTDDKRTYNINSPFQVIGAGSLNQTADKYLTDEEKRKLSAH